MITLDERQEVVKLGQADGTRLFRVSEVVYKVLIILNWITGTLGVVFALAIFATASNSFLGSTSEVLLGFVVLVVTAFVCVVNYAFAVLTTHVAKVLVHLLFCNLVILERDNSIDGGGKQ